MSTYTTSAGYKRELPPRPSTEEIIQTFADQYGISRDEAINWLGEVNWPHFAQDEVPFLDDLDDLSIHEPSIRTGESVSGLEQFIEQKATLANDFLYPDVARVVEVDDLREFMKGKVLVPTDNSWWIIFFDDADRKPEVFGGNGAEAAAKRRYEQISVSWNAHLFVKVDSNSRDFDRQHPTSSGGANSANNS